MNLLPSNTTADPEVVDATVAVLPVGSFEQHGPHLPLVTDTLIAAAIAVVIAERHPVLHLAPVTYSCSHEHAAFPGTISISAAALAAVITDIASSLRQQGIGQLVLVNGHGGNYVLSNLVQQANADGPLRMALYPAKEDWQEARTAAGITSTNHEDMHAGELETSILLACCPDQLRDGWQGDDHTADDRRLLTLSGMDAYTASGVIGLPSRATEAKGRAALEELAAGADAVLKALNEPSGT